MYIQALPMFLSCTLFRAPPPSAGGYCLETTASGSIRAAAGPPRAGTHFSLSRRGARPAPPGGSAHCSGRGRAPRPATPRPWPARPEEGLQRRRQRRQLRPTAQAPEQDGGASPARRRSGLGRLRPAAGRPLQPPARAPVSSAALSGRGRHGAEGAGPPVRVPVPALLPWGRATELRPQSVGPGRAEASAGTERLSGVLKVRAGTALGAEATSASRAGPACRTLTRIVAKWQTRRLRPQALESACRLLAGRPEKAFDPAQSLDVGISNGSRDTIYLLGYCEDE